jgi:hypothetical protein
MKAKVNLDKRSNAEKIWDAMYNAMVREAHLSPKQEAVVSIYLRNIIGLRIHEVESAVEMGFHIALIEGEKFGTDVKRGAKRLLRVQNNAVAARNEAYGKECIDANGCLTYDGCGLEHLQTRLARHGVEYQTRLDK